MRIFILVKLYINHNINCHIHINGTAENHIYTIATAPTLPSKVTKPTLLQVEKLTKKGFPFPTIPSHDDQ